MQLTEDESRRFNHEYIGTEHILLALVKEGGGGAATILKNLDVDQRTVRVEVEKLLAVGPKLATKPYRLPFTPPAKRVVEYAVEEVRGFGQHSIGTQHLLLALLHKRSGVACQVLMNLGVLLDDARAEAIKPIDDDHGMPHGTRGNQRRWFQFRRPD